MKIKQLEAMRDSQRAFHRDCKWHMQDGIYSLYAYDGEDEHNQALSWWDDVGFILGDRRVMVWWQHSRLAYRDHLGRVAHELAGEAPENDREARMVPYYIPVGRSRKKIFAYMESPAEEDSAIVQYQQQARDIQRRLDQEGVDYTVTPSWTRQRLSWMTGVRLVAPLEVHSRNDLKTVANLARRLLTGETTLLAEFPHYTYTQSDWLAEQQPA